ncbi:MAG: hypothetical protein J7L37_05150 [Thermococcus sp.]|nr:hypothetical protein [Thermococcus sp.]
MEGELIERVRSLIKAGDRYVEKRNFELAYDSYLDALYAVAAIIAHRETGRLMPIRELKPYLRVRHPGVHDTIERYSWMSSFDESTVRALKKEVVELIGMMNLPSPEK